MSMNKANYPSNWAEISKRIRERAGNKCEICGVENHAIIARKLSNPEEYLAWDDPKWDEIMYFHSDEYSEKNIRVVLTVAHYPDPNPMNCSDDNLLCLCQLHHLRLDAKHHAQNASRTRRRKHEEKTGQMSFLEDAS